MRGAVGSHMGHVRALESLPTERCRGEICGVNIVDIPVEVAPRFLRTSKLVEFGVGTTTTDLSCCIQVLVNWTTAPVQSNDVEKLGS